MSGMRPALLLLLVTLAAFCHSEETWLCPAIRNAARKFLYGSVEEYVEALAPYTTEPIMAVAERQLKQCTERLVQDEQALALLVNQLLSKC